MKLLDNLRNWFLAPLLDQDFQEHIKVVGERRDYRHGIQRRFLKRQRTGIDDNLILNMTGLVISRSVAMLFGKGVKFDLPGEGDEPEQVYIDAVMDANKQQILFHKLGILGSEQGTCYLKIIPDAIKAGSKETTDGETVEGEGRDLPRLIPQDPAWVRVETAPDDIDDVRKYTIQYAYSGPNGQEARKQEIIKDNGIDMDDDGNQYQAREQSWLVIDYVSSERTGGKWQEEKREQWPYEFSPILHWQNLPEPTDFYGMPDIPDDVIELQDKINFAASNINKIIRLYAHPQRWGKNLGTQNTIVLGPDEMPNYNHDGAAINQLEPVGDLAASNQFLQNMRESLFSITQTTDLTSFDRVSQLTNFGLRVLFSDSLAKLSVKRELYGDALLELVRRLLIIGGFENTYPGVLIWPDPLPVNEQELVEVLRGEMDMGILSKQGAALRVGTDWQQEEERIEEERQAEQERRGNLGGELLREFFRGGGGFESE